MTFAGALQLDQVRACTDAAFEAGINLFDTADVYRSGRGGAAWGEILKDRPRDSFITLPGRCSRLGDCAYTAPPQRPFRQVRATFDRS